MDLNYSTEDIFEELYKSKFLALTARHGMPIKYERDRAGIDLGIHLTNHGKVTNTRVWFQLKGRHESSLPLERFTAQDSVPFDVEIKHLRAWYKSPEPVYFVIYVESADLFIAEDTAEIINRQWGDELLNPSIFQPSQERVRINISTRKVVNEEFWKRLFAHKSMRTDGRSFRGRPLGHEHDPLTSLIRVMEPPIFIDLIKDMLNEHGYKVTEELDADAAFPGEDLSGNEASLSYGYLRDKFEIILSLTNEYIPNSDGTRHEGESRYVQGPCTVFIHNQVISPPSKEGLAHIAYDLVNRKKITRLLAFINSNMWAEEPNVSCFHVYTDLHKTGLKCFPLHIEDLGYNLCTTTNTYNRFRDKVSWYGKALWHKEKGPFSVLPPERSS